MKAGANVLQPIMAVEISVPEEFQGAALGAVSKRKGAITNTEQRCGQTRRRPSRTRAHPHARAHALTLTRTPSRTRYPAFAYATFNEWDRLPP